MCRVRAACLVNREAREPQGLFFVGLWCVGFRVGGGAKKLFCCQHVSVILNASTFASWILLPDSTAGIVAKLSFVFLPRL